MPSTSDEVTLDTKPAIVLHDASKTFQLKHTQSFKETLISAVKRKKLASSFNAVDRVDIAVPKGQSVALMGRNGSGKSTTLKLLSGVMRPDTGWVRTRGRVAGLLEVGAGFHPNLTGRENVYLNAAILGMSKQETDERFDEILEFSEIGDFIDTEVKHYSSGMYARLGFAVAVHTELDVLLVDEILSVGDAQFRAKCTQRMLDLQDQGKTMFIVSHSVAQVRQLCERGIVMDHGKVVLDGPIEEAIEFIKPVPKALEGAPKGGYPIEGIIKMIHDRNPAKFGRAVEPMQEITAHGGGLAQNFEFGYITMSNALDRAIGIRHGAFFDAYQEHGGPAGEWGFMRSNPQGSVSDGNRILRFQFGVATFAPELGVIFEADPARPASA